MCLKKAAFTTVINIQYLLKCYLLCLMVISSYIHFPDDHSYILFMSEYNSISDKIDDSFFIVSFTGGHWFTL